MLLRWVHFVFFTGLVPFSLVRPYVSEERNGTPSSSWTNMKISGNLDFCELSHRNPQLTVEVPVVFRCHGQ
jgi:hypothetical protein